MRLTREEYMERLRSIRLVAVDVDGVLTDGSIVYGSDDWEAKVFHVRDGSAVHIACDIGLPIAVITGRTSAAVARRFAELPTAALVQGCTNKLAAGEWICAERGLDLKEVAFIGDDLIDVPLLERVGLAVAVADAHPVALDAAHWVTETAGGRGALRELVDDMVEAHGAWGDLLEKMRARE